MIWKSQWISDNFMRRATSTLTFKFDLNFAQADWARDVAFRSES